MLWRPQLIAWGLAVKLSWPSDAQQWREAPDQGRRAEQTCELRSVAAGTARGPQKIIKIFGLI